MLMRGDSLPFLISPPHYPLPSSQIGRRPGVMPSWMSPRFPLPCPPLATWVQHVVAFVPAEVVAD